MTRLVLLLLLAGCVRGPVCAEGGCPEGTVCDLDGTCRALTVRAPPRRDQHLLAADFGGTRSDRPGESGADLDELLLGGAVDGAVFLAFDLPAGEVREAVLVLHPAEGASGGERQGVRLSRVRPFEGGELSHRRQPVVARVGPARELAPTVDRPVRVDVTALLQEEPAERVYLMATGDGDGDGVPWRVASPLALERSRAPRLELRLAR